jgi:hypothetical protein
LNPLSLFLRTSIPFTWRILSDFLPAWTPWLSGLRCFSQARLSSRTGVSSSTASVCCGPRSLLGSVALSLCTDAHPLYTISTSIVGTSISEATMRLNPRSPPRTWWSSTAAAGSWRARDPSTPRRRPPTPASTPWTPPRRRSACTCTRPRAPPAPGGWESLSHCVSPTLYIFCT